MEEYESDYCDVCGDEITSSHYHCGNCGGESSMFGHYNGMTDKFTCKFVHERDWNMSYVEDDNDQ